MGRVSQRNFYGRGVGGIFRGVNRFFKPLFNCLIPTISKAATSKTGQKLIKAAGDVISGENFKKSIRRSFQKNDF